SDSPGIPGWWRPLGRLPTAPMIRDFLWMNRLPGRWQGTGGQRDGPGDSTTYFTPTRTLCTFITGKCPVQAHPARGKSLKMVPGTGIEPVRLAARDFKSLVSTYSTIRARTAQKKHAVSRTRRHRENA